jgi:hypothetical protein
LCPGEGQPEGQPEGIPIDPCPPTIPPDWCWYRFVGDFNGDFRFDLSELLRIIQLFNAGEYHNDDAGEDGCAPGPGKRSGRPHSADYSPQDWRITLNELLRVIQLYNSGGFHPCADGEGGYCPGQP